MNITKYPQSTFLIEEQGKKIAIDIGNFTTEKFKKDTFNSLNAVLITHQHRDHLDKEVVGSLIEKGVPLYGNHDVAYLFEDKDFEITKVKHGDQFVVAGFKIEIIDLPHCQMLFCSECNEKISGNKMSLEKKCQDHPESEPKQVDGPPNSGFLVGGVFFHPGDGIELDNFEVENIGIPIAGPTIDYDRAWKFATSVKAAKIIPMHYSNSIFPADPQEFAKKNSGSAQVEILNDGSSIEISQQTR